MHFFYTNVDLSLMFFSLIVDLCYLQISLCKLHLKKIFRWATCLAPAEATPALHSILSAGNAPCFFIYEFTTWLKCLNNKHYALSSSLFHQLLFPNRYIFLHFLLPIFFYFYVSVITEGTVLPNVFFFFSVDGFIKAYVMWFQGLLIVFIIQYL